MSVTHAVDGQEGKTVIDANVTRTLCGITLMEAWDSRGGFNLTINEDGGPETDHDCPQCLRVLESRQRPQKSAVVTVNRVYEGGVKTPSPKLPDYMGISASIDDTPLQRARGSIAVFFPGSTTDTQAKDAVKAATVSMGKARSCACTLNDGIHDAGCDRCPVLPPRASVYEGMTVKCRFCRGRAELGGLVLGKPACDNCCERMKHSHRMEVRRVRRGDEHDFVAARDLTSPATRAVVLKKPVGPQPCDNDEDVP